MNWIAITRRQCPSSAASIVASAIALFIAGSAVAAERGSGRPNAVVENAHAIRETANPDWNRRHRHRVLITDRARRTPVDLRQPTTVGRQAPPVWGEIADRTNADLPPADIQICGWRADDLDPDRPDRGHDVFLEVATLDAAIRSIVDPFGLWTAVADGDDRGHTARSATSTIIICCDPMDRDADGDIDTDDLALLISAFGTAEGDLDGDGLVSGSDLGLMLVRLSSLQAVD